MNFEIKVFPEPPSHPGLGILFKVHVIIIILCVCWGEGSHPLKLKDYFWFCTQELLLAVLEGPYGMPEIKSG